MSQNFGNAHLNEIEVSSTEVTQVHSVVEAVLPAPHNVESERNGREARSL